MNILLWLVLTALAPVIWGSTYIVTSELLPESLPFTAAVIRCVPAGVLLIMLSGFMPQAGQWRKLIALSALNIGVFQACLFMAAYRLPGGLAAVIGAIQPVIMLGLTWVILKTRPAKVSVFAALAAVIGMAILIMAPMAQQGVSWDVLGISAAAIGALSMALGMFFSRHWHDDDSTLAIPLLAFTGWQLTLGGLMLWPLAWLIDPVLPQLTPSHMLAYGYLALVGTLLTYLLWFKGIRQLPPVAVSSLGLLSPLSAIILGWLILGQNIEGWALVGLVIVIISILLVQWSQNTAVNSKKSNIDPVDKESAICKPQFVK